MSRALILFRWANVLLILLTLLAYLSPIISPVELWPFAFLGVLYPWLLFANILFVLFWLLQGKWYLFLSLGCILLGWGHFRSFVGFHLPAEKREGVTLLRVMSFNCHGMRDREHWGEYLEAEELTRLMKGRDPDILCLQEFPSKIKQAQKYIDFLSSHSELKYHYGEDGGLFIFSRYPLENVTSKYFENGANGYQVIDLTMEERALRVFNVHLQSNAVASLADKVAEKGDIKERETWLNLKGMVNRYRRSAQERVWQTEELLAVVDSSTVPVIVCGDFNDVPLSYIYNQLSSKLTDAFKIRGMGLGTTYDGNIPALRIDYIFVDPSFQVQEYETGRLSFSDHRPVRAALVLVK